MISEVKINWNMTEWREFVMTSRAVGQERLCPHLEKRKQTTFFYVQGGVFSQALFFQEDL